MPQPVDHLGQRYRRLKEKTPPTKVLTRSGNITLTRAAYHHGRYRRRRKFRALFAVRLRAVRILWGVRSP